MTDKEEIIWEGGSSQILNFWTYFFCFLLSIAFAFAGMTYNPLIYFGIIVVALYAFWSYLEIATQIYRLTNQRIIIQHGILTKITDELELYRVKDHRLEQPIFLRIFGLGNIIIITSDRLNEVIIFKALENSENLRESIRKLVENRRSSRGVREIDTV